MKKVTENNGKGNSRNANTIYSPEKVAEILEVKVSFVKRLLREGTLRGFKMGKFWRIPEDALNGYINGCQDMNNGKRTVGVDTKAKIRFHASIRSQDSLPKSVKGAADLVSTLKDELETQSGMKKLATIARLKSAISLREELTLKYSELSERQNKLAERAYKDLVGLVDSDADAIEGTLMQGVKKHQSNTMVSQLSEEALAEIKEEMAKEGLLTYQVAAGGNDDDDDDDNNGPAPAVQDF
jgi:excisionase family DNA binding protein